MNIKTILGVIYFALTFTVVQAQEKNEKKKVVIITKTMENGKVNVVRKEAEGEEAEALMEEIGPESIETVEVKKEKDGSKTVQITKSNTKLSTSVHRDKSGGKEIEVTSETKDGVTKEKYKIIKKTPEGDEVTIWEGDEEMPEELKEELKNIKIRRSSVGDNMEIRIEHDDEDIDDDDNVVMIERNRDRRPGKMQWIDEDDRTFRGDRENMNMKFRSENTNSNKVSMGVMIDDTADGVVIDEIVEGSAAAAAGLRRGDIILKVENKYIFSSEGLLNALHPYNVNDKAKIRYIREGKEKTATLTFKANKN
ncbi:MAG: PDZ domain-containing protein [Saprospiraceae bacterium]